MDREMVELNVLNLVGITTRTNNKNELDPEKAKISSMAKKYWGQNIAGKFKHRKNMLRLRSHKSFFVLSLAKAFLNLLQPNCCS